MEKFSFSVVIPVYNEEKVLHHFLSELLNFLPSIGRPYEVIAVDDGSTDKSFDIISRFNNIKAIRHDINRGYGKALKSGVLAAKYDKILIIDADGTHPIEKINDLVKESDNHDMVVGARTGTIVHQPIFKKIGKWPVNQLANYLVGFKIPDLNSGLRIFKRDVALKYFKLLPNGFSFTTNITLAFLSDGYSVKYIPINYFERIGRSKVRPRDAINYLVLVIRMILFYNPLKIFLPVSISFLLAALASFIYDVWFLDNITEKSIVFFVGFVQLLVLGFLADLINKRGPN